MRECIPYARCKFRLSGHRVVDLALSLKELTEMESEKRQNIPASVPCVWVNYASYKFQSPPFPFTVEKKNSISLAQTNNQFSFALSGIFQFAVS